jgi:AraC-like DNA-binding protein
MPIELTSSSASSDAGIAPRAEFATRHLAAADQFDGWRAHYRDIFDLTLASGRADQYDATHRSWDLGGLTFTQAMMPDGVGRRWRHWQRPVRDDWIIVVATSSSAGGSRAPVSDIGFRSLARPFEGVGHDGHILSLFLPRDQFRDEAPVFDKAPVRLPHAGIAGLIGDLMLSLDGKLTELSTGGREGVAAALRSMVPACISPSPEHLERAGRALMHAVREKAAQIVRRNLGKPGLGPAMIAASLGISRASLYRAFEPHGGVVAYIQRERLDEAYRRLSVPGQGGTISALAWELGYPDPSTFTRAFRRRFGHAPRDLVGPRADSFD